ncbi:hypothetical protein EV424DRAFT_1604979 [Suillus variegatus]|nr:hypothetical protein EV424DRAFT_1604979 [Suillus variegatus]
MEYSTDDISAARSLQFATYIHMSMATFWTYDYACSLHEEWTFLLRSRWCKMKAFYIVTRYFSFIFLATDLYRAFRSSTHRSDNGLTFLVYFAPNENPGKCRVLENIQSGLGTVLVVFSEYFFVSRTYVLWNKNRVLLAAIVCTSFVSSKSTHGIQASGRCISQIVLVASFSIVFATDVPASYATSVIPGISGCYQSSSRYQLSIPFILLSVFELGLMILTLIHAIQDWRTNTSRLYGVLVNHNIFYYACGSRESTLLRAVFPYSFMIILFAEVISVTNIITSLLLQDSYQTILYDFQFIMLAILAMRMHLHLWQVNRHPQGSTSTLAMSDISFANPTV